MEVSQGEKLIIHMLSDLFEHLGVESELDPGFIKRALDGQSWAISSRYGFTERGDRDDSVANEVGEILHMWRIIEETVEGFDEQQQTQLVELAPVFGKTVKFPGFDANASSGHYGTAVFLVKEDFGWDHFRGRNLNSHGAGTVEGHRRMRARFKEVMRQRNFEQLTPKDMASVLNERTHPENQD
ncbi:MAG: YfbU family protein [Alphaproteobacteria bacterium]|uniref:Uncharacterized protein n=1 Tax=viral metagenome TaxID=1070528 RepID=A0A6H1ZIG9_9ZZZZ|nr:YfbU family protein [Alphaproteobacteria bacterium]MBU2379191.1 YfbU family protein [Alphaproteobacteria bacterium]